jgi:hypothetical protein
MGERLEYRNGVVGNRAGVLQLLKRRGWELLQAEIHLRKGDEELEKGPHQLEA